MNSNISPIRNVAAVVRNDYGDSARITKLVLQVDKNDSAPFKTLLTDCFGDRFNNFLAIEHQKQGFEHSFKVNGTSLPLENNERSLKKFNELAKLFQIAGKREKPFPVDKDYLGSLHCAHNLDYNTDRALEDLDKIEIEQAHSLGFVQKIANEMTTNIVNLTTEFFDANFTDVIKGLRRNNLWIR